MKNSPMFVSSLSPYVRTLACEKGVDDTQKNVQVGHRWFQDLVLHVDRISEALPDEEDSPDYFEHCVSQLAPLFKDVFTYLNHMTPAKFRQHYKDLLRWTGSGDTLDEAFHLLQQSTAGNSELSALMITACLERGLGNLYLLNGYQCPNMLKDLLSSPQLRCAIGDHCIKLLRILVGPPISLNLRNIVWHGFCSPNEVPKQYWYTLLLMMATVGRVLHLKAMSVIPNKPYVTLDRFDELYKVFLDVPSDQCSLRSLKCLMKDSNFVSSQMMPYMKCAISQWYENQYGFCTTLLLPVLEHSLRAVFAQVNDCPGRVLTAESSTLYTTFDEILSQYMPDGTANKLRGYLGDGFMDLLHDLLMYQEGCRVRDRVSHGQCDFTAVPKSTAQVVMCLMAALCLQCLPKELTSSEFQYSPWNEVHDIVVNYESRYHPMSRLKGQVIKISQDLQDLDTLPKPVIDLNPGLNPNTGLVDAAKICCKYYEPILPLLHHLLGYLRPEHNYSALEQVLSVKLNTLYRGQTRDNQAEENGKRFISELEVVGVLRQAMTQCGEVIQQVLLFGRERFAQWEAKTMRSRQRSNYHKFLACLPWITEGIRLLVVIAVCEMYSLNQSTCDLRKLRYLKQVLQISENLNTSTGPSKNKWDESTDLISKLAESSTNYHQYLVTEQR